MLVICVKRIAFAIILRESSIQPDINPLPCPPPPPPPPPPHSNRLNTLSLSLAKATVEWFLLLYPTLVQMWNPYLFFFIHISFFIIRFLWIWAWFWMNGKVRENMIFQTFNQGLMLKNMIDLFILSAFLTSNINPRWVTNLANTKWCEKLQKWLKPWHMVTHLRVLTVRELSNEYQHDSV